MVAQIPMEILEAICSHLKPSSLKMIRLAGRRICLAANKSFFFTMSIIDRYSSVVKHQALFKAGHAPLVKRLVWATMFKNVNFINMDGE